MLVHIGQTEEAARVHNAWLKTIEDGIHTYDIFKPDVSKQKVGTREFADAVIARIGQKPETLKAVQYAAGGGRPITHSRIEAKAELTGVDVYVNWNGYQAGELAEVLQKANGEGLALQMISNRGVKVWPEGMPETFTVDNWRCRFIGEKGQVTQQQTVSLLGRVAALGLPIAKMEHLHYFDGVPGFSLAQGQ
jgi:isocitrate dehydrogenase